jgi:uncharacterized repeat protein (TIGR01451 family)
MKSRIVVYRVCLALYIALFTGTILPTSHPAIAQVSSTDADGDGTPNVDDIDDDNDGILDVNEMASVSSAANGGFSDGSITTVTANRRYTQTAGAVTINYLNTNSTGTIAPFTEPTVKAEELYATGTSISYVYPFQGAKQEMTFSQSGAPKSVYSKFYITDIDQSGENHIIKVYDQNGNLIANPGSYVRTTAEGTSGASAPGTPTQFTGIGSQVLVTPGVNSVTVTPNPAADNNTFLRSRIVFFDFSGIQISKIEVENVGTAGQPGFLFDIIATPLDTDSDGIPDHLDIDSDNDGITDNVEAQTTAGYVAPSGIGAAMTDVDDDGLDDQYDANTSSKFTSTSKGLTPVDTDSDGTKDFLDTNSDGDSLNDIAERGDGQPISVTSTIDSDGDGLLDIFEGSSTTDFFDVNDENRDAAGNFNLADTDNDTAANGAGAVPLTADLDYRDVPSLDRSDAPVSYGEATHVIINGIRLGAAIDSDGASIANATASGDGTDDDGISSFPTLTAGSTSYRIPAANITATGTGTLHAWIDFNKNGTFDAGEYTSVAVASNTPAGPLNWSGITAGAAGNTFARFRFTSDATVTASNPSGIASNGEVEDYQVSIAASTSISGKVWNDANGNGIQETATYTNEPNTDTVSDTANDDLYAVLTDSVGNVLQVAPVNDSTGAYTFSNAPSSTSVKVLLSAQSVSVGSTFTASNLPSGWTATQPAASAQIFTTAATNTNKNFGIRRVNPDLASNFCQSTPDMMFILDDSSSVDDTEVGQQRAGVMTMLTYFVNNNIPARAAIVGFDAEKQTVIGYTDVTAANLPLFQTALNTKYGVDGNGTNWENGFQEAVTVGGSPDVVFFFTDGRQTSGASPIDEADQLKAVGAHIYGIRIEDPSINLDSFKLVTDGEATTQFSKTAENAATADYVSVNNYAQLGSALTELVPFICPPSPDRSDAPVSYGEATHTVVNSIKLGAAIDRDAASIANATASGDGTDDDGISSFPTLNAGATSYSIPAANVTATGTGTLHAWIDFNKDGLFSATEYQSVSVTNGTVSGPLNWTGINVGSTGNTFARFRFTASTLTDNTGTTTDERAVGPANDGEVEDYQVAIAQPIASDPNLLLVKRITAINPGQPNAIQFNNFIDDNGTTNDNNLKWPDSDSNPGNNINNYLRGAISVPQIKPGDEVEYTIYFLSNGDADAKNIQICDVVPDNMTFNKNSYGTEVGMSLALNSTTLPIIPNKNLSNLIDTDEGSFYAPGTNPLINLCKKHNPNNPNNLIPVDSSNNLSGAVLINLSTPLPPATATGTPPDSYGFVRFRAKVK